MPPKEIQCILVTADGRPLLTQNVALELTSDEKYCTLGESVNIRISPETQMLLNKGTDERKRQICERIMQAFTKAIKEVMDDF